MQNQIIYQKQPSLIGKLCSCLRVFGRRASEGIYQLGIESPKNAIVAMNRKTLVIDLDETLVHSAFQGNGEEDFDLIVSVQGMTFRVYVTIRPGAERFLEKMSEFYDVILWTASMQQYADPVMDRIDPGNRCVRRMYRESCTALGNGLTKDLCILEKDLRDVVIIDNSQLSFQLQSENAYHIRDFYYDKSDRELDRLTPFFIWLSSQFEVRSVSKNYNYFIHNPISLASSRRQSFIQQQVYDQQQQYDQYEEQQILGVNARVNGGKQLQLSQSLTLTLPNNNNKNVQQRAITADDETYVRTSCNINSPHQETKHNKKQQQQEQQQQDSEQSESTENLDI